jgi:hypothetical protein
MMKKSVSAIKDNLSALSTRFTIRTIHSLMYDSLFAVYDKKLDYYISLYNNKKEAEQDLRFLLSKD